MTKSRRIFLLALSWLWLVAVFGYMIWGAFEYHGLYRWLAEWQIGQWGGYYRKWTAVLPGLILALPAFAYIGLHARRLQAAEANDKAAQARTVKRSGRWLMLIGVVLVLGGGGAFAWSQMLPDGSEPAQTIDGARLASGQVPVTKVRIRGTEDASARVQYLRRGADEQAIFYAGFRLEDKDGDGPIRLFIERNAPGPEGLTTLQAFLPEQAGYLIENDLPSDVLDELRARGINVATPHWVMKTGDLALREPYYIAAALGGFIGLVFLLVGFATWLQGRRRAWLATAIRPDGASAGGAPGN